MRRSLSKSVSSPFLFLFNSCSGPSNNLYLFCVLALRGASDNMEGKSTGYIVLDSSLVGVFNLFDISRTGAKEALKELESMGIKTTVLTGDSQAAAIHAQTEGVH